MTLWEMAQSIQNVKHSIGQMNHSLNKSMAFTKKKDRYSPLNNKKNVWILWVALDLDRPTLQRYFRVKEIWLGTGY